MKKALIKMLICPSCLPEEYGLTENVAKTQGEDIVEGYLSCPKCLKAYPIENGLAFLDPTDSHEKKYNSRYETDDLVSSYLWSHFGDLLQDPQASDAYIRWAEMMNDHSSICLDIGSSVGRFSFEMSKKTEFVIGIDSSVSFIRTARKLLNEKRLEIELAEEGRLKRSDTLQLPGSWKMDKIEFIVADAQALPFRSEVFSAVSSLNIIDKVPLPMKHLTEINRVGKKIKAEFLLSDPFSWSESVAKEEDWLGGKTDGPFSGKGLENIIALLKGEKEYILPPWTIDKQGYIWWKIRTHRNHFELIRSCFIKAFR